MTSVNRGLARSLCALVFSIFGLSASFGAHAQNALTTNLAFDPNVIVPGDPAVMTIYVVNNNSAPATALAIDSALPAGLQIVGYGSGAGPYGEPNCGGTQSGNGGPSGGSYGLSGGSVPGINAGQAGVCVVKYLVTSYAAAGQTYPTTLAPTAVSASVGGNQVNAATSASNSLTVQNMTPLNGDKNFSPSTSATGGSVTLTINIANQNNFDMGGVAYSDALPNGMTLLSAPAPTATGCGSATLSAAPGSASVGIADATITAGATCIVVVGVQAPASTGNAVNTIPAGAVTSSQRGAAAANTSPIEATLSVQDQLSVAKSFAADNVFVDGSPTTMTIQIRNPTQYPVSNLAFNDAFPGAPGFVLDASAGGSAPVVSDSCNFNHANVTDGAGALAVTGGSVAANGSCQIVVWVRGRAAGAYVNQLGVNTVTGMGGANGNTPTSNGNAASATLSVSTISNGGGPGNYRPNLYKRLSTAPWMPGNPTFNTTLRVTRPGDPATTQVAYVFVVIGNTLTTSALSLATLSDVLDATGFTNIAGRSLHVDPATVAQNVTYGPYGNTPGQTCSLGTVTATGSTATTLNLQFANTSVPAAAAQSDGGINPGTCVISFPVYIDATQPISDSLGTYHDALGANSVTGSIVANGIGFSAGPSDGVTLVVNDGVTIRKSFYPTTVAPNGVADLKITLTNVNAMPLTGVSYQDPLPAGLVLAGNGSPAFSADCGAAGLSSAVVNGQTVLTIANASVPAATGSPVNPGTCVLDVYVQQAAGQPQSANYPNQIAAGSMTSDQGISNTQSSNTAMLSVGDLSIAVSKSFAQATVTAGETTSMSIVVTNPQTANGATLNNVSFQDAFPAGLIAAANPNIQVTCSAGSTGAPANASLSSATPPVLSIAGIVLASGGSCTISVDVQLTTANAPVTNVIPSGTVTTREGATNVGNASATIVSVPSSAVVKSIAPATATIGQPVTATVRVLNTTAGAIGGIDVLDRINPSGGYPAGVVPQGYLAPPNATWRIVPGSVALAPNSPAGCVLGSNVTIAGTANDETRLTGITVPANAYCDITYQLVASTPGGQYRNAILQADVSGGPVVCANNQNPCFTYGDLNVVVPGSIYLAKQTSGGTPAAGAQWSFTLTPTDGCSVAGVTPNPLVLAAGASGSFASVPPVQGDGTTPCHYDIVESGGDPDFVLSNPTALQNLSVGPGARLPLTANNTYAPRPQVGIAKTTTATGIAPNGTIVYTVTASNTGVVDASGAVLADPLPAGVASVTWTCTPNGGAQCPSASGSGAINATIATFPVGSNLTYTVTATIAANPPANIVNTATVTRPGGGTCANGNAPPCSATVTTPVTPLIDIRKSTTQTVVPAGGTLTYSVIVSNAGTVDAGGTRIGDPLPAGITAASWTCAASGSVQCPHASGSGALDETVAAPFAPAASLTYTITATVSTTPPASIVNVASTTPPNGGSCANGQAPPCTSTAITPPGPVVGVSKTTSATRVAASGTIVYTVAATNLGAVDGAGTTLADPLPAGIASATWTCAANGGAQCPAASGSGAINAALAVFPAGSSLVYSVTATVAANPPANIVNVATVTPPGGGTCTGGQTPPCTSTVTTPVAPTVAVSKTTTATSATAGGTITYTVTASNVGSAAAAGTTLADPLPAGIAGATWTCVASGGAQCPAASGAGAINQTIATFPAGSSLVYSVTATVAANPPANIVNVALVTPPGGGTCAGGQTPPCTSTVTTPVAPTVAISKTTTATSATAGGTITYTVTASNVGSAAAAGTTLADPLPAGIASATWTCVASGGAQCPAASGSGAINATLAVFPAGSSLVYSVTATVAANPPANIVNVATVTPPGGGICTGGQTPPCTSTVTTPVAPTVAVSKTTTATSATAGGTITYTVTASNVGSADAAGTTLADPLPAGIASAAWTCVASGGAQCPAASGAGAINQTIATFPAGSSLVYSVTATVAANPPANIVNVATVTPPGGSSSCAGGRAPPCTSTVTTPAGKAQVDIAKSASSTVLEAIGNVDYVVTVRNSGTVDASGSSVSDPLPAGIASVSWTCSASGGAQCPSASGIGAINATIAVFPVGSSLVYAISAQLSAAPPQSVTNIASVTPPAGGTCANGQMPPCTAAVTGTVAEPGSVDTAKVPATTNWGLALVAFAMLMSAWRRVEKARRRH